MHDVLHSLSLTAYINDLSRLVRMNEFICMFPPPLLLALLHESVVDIADNATHWYPYDGGNYYHGTHYIILQKAHNFVDVYILDNIPESFHYILNRFLAHTLKKCTYTILDIKKTFILYESTTMYRTLLQKP